MTRMACSGCGSRRCNHDSASIAVPLTCGHEGAVDCSGEGAMRSSSVLFEKVHR